MRIGWLGVIGVCGLASMVACGDSGGDPAGSTTLAATEDPATTAVPSTTAPTTGSVGDPATGDPGTTSTVASATDAPTTGVELTSDASVTTDDPGDTTTAELPCDPDAPRDGHIIPLDVSAPIFTADGKSLVVNLVGERKTTIAQISLCGDVLTTLVTDHDDTQSVLVLNPANDRLYYSYALDFDDAGVRSVAFPAGGAPTQHLVEFGLYGFGVHPQETFAVYAINGGDPFRFDLPMGAPQPITIETPPEVFGFAPDGHAVAYLDDDHDLRIWNLADDAVTLAVPATATNGYNLQWTADSQRVAFIGQIEFTTYLRTYDTASEQLVEVQELKGNFGDFALSPDESLLAIPWSDGIEYQGIRPWRL